MNNTKFDNRTVKTLTLISPNKDIKLDIENNNHGSH